ncbi:hypothetical protein [Bacillus sp. AFS014408]|nr:hypothetical protein [Bacillus sp. AFS014408]
MMGVFLSEKFDDNLLYYNFFKRKSLIDKELSALENKMAMDEVEKLFAK